MLFHPIVANTYRKDCETFRELPKPRSEI
jgi:hypothetical protein